MRTSRAVLVLVSVIALASASPAFGWGSATHAYIGHTLRAQAGPVDLDELYGSMAPDLFNFLFATDYAAFAPYLYGLSHGDGAELRAAVRSGREKAGLYGFIVHSDIIGADLTAHHASLTLDPEQGYVVTKALALREILDAVPQYAALGLSPEASLDVCHNLVESAGDLLIAAAEPRVGAWMAASAARPAAPLQGLLARAWTPGLVAYAASLGVTLPEADAAAIVVGSEAWFRERMAAMGALLQQDAAAAFDGTVTDFAALSRLYLKSFGVELPDDLDISPLIAFGLARAMELCSADYLTEVDATAAMTGAQLRRLRVLQPAR
jgi:hypothetical protein